MIAVCKVFVLCFFALGSRVNGQLCTLGSSKNLPSCPVTATNTGYRCDGSTAQFCAYFKTAANVGALSTACAAGMIPAANLVTVDQMLSYNALYQNPAGFNGVKFVIDARRNSDNTWQNLAGTATIATPPTSIETVATCATPASGYVIVTVTIGNPNVIACVANTATGPFNVLCIGATTNTPIIDGGLTPSSPISRCSKCDAAGGTTFTTKTCTNPPRANGGAACAGTAVNNEGLDAVSTAPTACVSSPKCKVCLSVGGFETGTYKVSTKVDVFVPGQTCTKAIPDMPLPLTNLYVAYIGTRLWVCGEYAAEYGCIAYIPANNAWDATFATTFSHNGFNAIDDGSKIYVMSDIRPEVFDPATSQWNYWKGTTAPLQPVKKTNGGSCLVKATVGVTTYIYSFGGASTRAVQRFAINPIGTKWEYMTDLPGDSTFQSCAPYSANYNMIMVIMNGPGFNAVLYELYGNLFARAPTYVNSNVDLFGAELLEPGFDGKMYAFGQNEFSSGAVRAYNPTGTGEGYWTSVPGVSQWSPGRNMASVICIDRDVVNAVCAGFKQNQLSTSSA